MTFNVMFPARKLVNKMFIDSTARYSFQFDNLFSELDQDIICLQEVTETYIDQLDHSSFLKRGYKRTPAMQDSPENHFPMIVSRLPYVVLHNSDMVVV